MKILLLSVAGLLCVSALTAPASAAETYTVSGVVIGDDQKPLVGASVRVGGANPDLVVTTETDESGQWSVEVPPNEYGVSFSDDAAGYVPESYEDDVDFGYDSSRARFVTVRDRDVPGIDAHLVRPGIVSGRVLAGGKPIKTGTSVELREHFAGSAGAWGSTASDGTFRIKDVLPGTYAVVLDDEPKGYTNGTPATVVVPSGGHVKMPTRSLTKLSHFGRISGTATITGGSSTPPEVILHRVRQSSLERPAHVLEPKQPFEFAKLEPGTYKIALGENAWLGGRSFFSASTVTVRKGHTTRLKVRGDAGSTVWADVQNTRGLGIPNVTAILRRTGDTTEEIAVTTSGDWGRVVFKDVPKGSYQITLQDPSGEYVDETVAYLPEDGPTPIVLQHSPPLDDIPPEKSAAIHVKSYGPRGASPVLFREDDDVVPAPVTVENGGIRRVAPGRYKVRLGEHSWLGGRSAATGTVVTVDAGETKTLEVYGIPSVAEVVGSVIGDDDIVPPSSMVTVFAADDPHEVIAHREFEHTFQFDQLPVDAYKIRISDPTGRYATRWYGGGTSFATARTITPHVSDRTTLGTLRLNRQFVAVSAPVVHGSPVVGRRLTTTNATFTLKKSSASRRWYRDGEAIKGATSTAYRVTSRDVGHRLTYRVTARRSHEPPASATSVPTGPVRRR